MEFLGQTNPCCCLRIENKVPERRSARNPSLGPSFVWIQEVGNLEIYSWALLSVPPCPYDGPEERCSLVRTAFKGPPLPFLLLPLGGHLLHPAACLALATAPDAIFPLWVQLAASRLLWVCWQELTYLRPSHLRNTPACYYYLCT